MAIDSHDIMHYVAVPSSKSPVKAKPSSKIKTAQLSPGIASGIIAWRCVRARACVYMRARQYEWLDHFGSDITDLSHEAAKGGQGST